MTNIANIQIDLKHNRLHRNELTGTWSLPTCSLVFRVTFRPTGPGWSPDKHPSRRNTTSQLGGLEYERSGWTCEQACLFLADARSRHHPSTRWINNYTSQRATRRVRSLILAAVTYYVFNVLWFSHPFLARRGTFAVCSITICWSSTKHWASLCFGGLHDCYVNEGNIFWLMSASNLLLRWQKITKK